MLISAMFWQKRDTQAVPSACSRWPPVGSAALRSKTPMLSSPRKPPSKRFLPKRSLRFTHQLKFSINFENDRLSKSISPFPLDACSIQYNKIKNHPCTALIPHPNIHSYSRITPLALHKNSHR